MIFSPFLNKYLFSEKKSDYNLTVQDMRAKKIVLTPLISAGEIKKRVKSLAAEIDSFFEADDIIALGVLKGALFFMSDLLKQMRNDMIYDFIQAKSYEGTLSTKSVKILKEPNLNLHKKRVLLIEDILDTGFTLKGIINYLDGKKVKDIYICTLLDKKGRREVNIKADFIGFEIDNLFVVGYGLDYDEKFRNLKNISVLNIIS